MKLSDEEKALARLEVGFHSQLRYYRLLESLGFTWASPVRKKIQEMHERNLHELNAWIAQKEIA